MTTATTIRPTVQQVPERCTHNQTRHLVEAMQFTGWGEHDSGHTLLRWLRENGVKAQREDRRGGLGSPTKIVMVLDRHGGHCAHVGDWIVFDRADNQWCRMDDLTFRDTFGREKYRATS